MNKTIKFRKYNWHYWKTIKVILSIIYILYLLISKVDTINETLISMLFGIILLVVYFIGGKND